MDRTERKRVSFAEVADWFANTGDIPAKLLEHLQLAFPPVVAAAAIALPVGLYIGHARRFERVAVATANLGRAIPSFAILALALIVSIRIGLGLGFWPTFAALFFLSLPPIVTNTHVGVKGVDAPTVEAARGMGLSESAVLRQVELPLASPLIVAGLRTAAVQSVATATLGAFVAGGGLGDYIRLGFRAGDRGALIGGALLVAALAIATEALLGLLEARSRRATGTVSGRGALAESAGASEGFAA